VTERITSAVTSLSWIPSEAITGSTRLPFDLGVTHYDDPPPEVIDDLDALHRAGAFRFANRLEGWVEVDDDGRIVAAGQSGGGLLSPTFAKVGPARIRFQPTAFPDLVPPADWGATSATFRQTCGGRPGIPAPRKVHHPPFLQLRGPTVWTTLALTIRADGTSSFELEGASPFPRHWLYGDDGRLAAKAGLIDFKDWYGNAFGSHSPWGDEDSPALTATVETALERELATRIMRGGAAEPVLRRLEPGEVLVEQGAPGAWMFLLLDGILGVTVDGEPVAELGPGAVVGERAALEDGRRTATLTARTAARVAAVPVEDVEPAALEALAEGHRREEGESV
jgi:hypothetical protein